MIIWLVAGRQTLFRYKANCKNLGDFAATYREKKRRVFYPGLCRRGDACSLVMKERHRYQFQVP